jgi:hypothetical protein
MKLEDMPEVLTAQLIAKHLKIARQTVYEYFDKPVELGGIPNYQIGNSRRVDKADFIWFIENRKRIHKEEIDQRYAYIRGERKGVKKVG